MEYVNRICKVGAHTSIQISKKYNYTKYKVRHSIFGAKKKNINAINSL